MEQPGLSYLHYWQVFWFGDALGLLVVGTAILVWKEREIRQLLSNGFVVFEAVVLGVGLSVTATWVFGKFNPDMPTLYLLFPFLLWSAVRFGRHGATVAILVTTGFALGAAAKGLGPFAELSNIDNALALQGLLAVVTLSTLTIAIAIEELRKQAKALREEVAGHQLTQGKLMAQGHRRVQAEESLKKSEERMSLAAESTNLGLWDLDFGTNRMWATEQCRKILGLNAGAEVSRQSFIDACHPGDRPTATRIRAEAIVQGRSYEQEYRVLRADRRNGWVLERGRIICDASQAPVSMTGVLIDITERRHAEEEATHLARIATLGELSGALAHELNQPLTAILSNAQAAQRLLEKTSVDLADLSEILHDIVEDDKRASKVIDRLRGLFSKREPQFESLGIDELIEEVLQLAHSQLVTHHVKAVTRTTPGLLAVRGDRIQLGQVLLNLVINGCEAMNSTNPVERELRISTHAGTDGLVQIEIADFGKGISPDVADRMFQPFFTDKEHGMGLGLSISRSIISAHGGRLWAANNRDRGATFFIELPAINGMGR